MITEVNISKRLKGIYRHMILRCYSPLNPGFKYYRAKGIKVYQPWIDDRDRFFKWAVENGYQDNLEIDRINGKEGYNPGNCRWVTKKANLENRDILKVFIEFRGQTYHLKDLCDKYCLSYTAAYNRLIIHKKDVEDYVVRKGNINLRKKLNAVADFYSFS